ncbi:MAG: hypothetical protein A2X77_04695 [Gammaproteobacteria bacterium GWE2_42_36]|nr:MAG: hypothetical protein A2X77_04695 [Gammaproteobacteria bacterium GWE2_42_36]
MINKFYQNHFKQWIDFLIASILLLVFFPLFLLLFFLVRRFLGKPVLFKQIRPGKNAQLFTLYKFRTMKEIYDAAGNLLPDEQRLTKFGLFLRRTSFDELPELWNVFRGDMSLVGPRPLLKEYLPLYSAEQKRRHEVKSGLTGLVQVSGRNNLSWEDKFKLDIWYVDHVSLWVDIKILFLTFFKVLKSEGISQPGHVTMEYFTGSMADSKGEKQ